MRMRLLSAVGVEGGGGGGGGQPMEMSVYVSAIFVNSEYLSVKQLVGKCVVNLLCD